MIQPWIIYSKRKIITEKGEGDKLQLYTVTPSMDENQYFGSKAELLLSNLI